PARTSGALMQPINYENHCRGCHPLSTGAGEAKLELPHRWQPDRLREFLTGALTGRALRAEPALLDRPVARIPGKPPAAEAETLRRRVGDQAAALERELYLGTKLCAECHHFTGADAGTEREPFARLRVERTNVPDQWYEHSRFRHAPHQMLACTGCHAAAT